MHDIIHGHQGEYNAIMASVVMGIASVFVLNLKVYTAANHWLRLWCRLLSSNFH